jgi:hypothetical protein
MRGEMLESFRDWRKILGVTEGANWMIETVKVVIVIRYWISSKIFFNVMTQKEVDVGTRVRDGTLYVYLPS